MLVLASSIVNKDGLNKLILIGVIYLECLLKLFLAKFNSLNLQSVLFNLTP